MDLLFLNNPECLFAGIGFVQVISLRSQVYFQSIDDIRLIVTNQNNIIK